MNDYNFGNFVCAMRERKGLTQADIARELNITPAAVSKWENGESKPRVEILFRLAKILEVRPEELMAGRLLPEETVDPEAVKRISEQYEYLRRTESYATVSVKLRRLLAAAIDWNLSGIIVVIFLIAELMHINPALNNGYYAFLVVLGCLSFPTFFVLRDFIWRGRSLGKRIMQLTVLDNQTAKKPPAWKTVVRNLFVFIIQIDMVVMLVSGRSIGDHVAQTVVVSKNNLDNIAANIKLKEINSYQVPPHQEKQRLIRNIIIAAVTIIVFVCLVISVVFMSLYLSTQTPEYAVAYDYLTNSEAFAATGANESSIRLNARSTTMYSSPDHAQPIAEFSFIVSSHEFQVVCHKNGEEWYACTECTTFS